MCPHPIQLMTKNTYIKSHEEDWVWPLWHKMHGIIMADEQLFCWCILQTSVLNVEFSKSKIMNLSVDDDISWYLLGCRLFEKQSQATKPNFVSYNLSYFNSDFGKITKCECILTPILRQWPVATAVMCCCYLQLQPQWNKLIVPLLDEALKINNHENHYKSYSLAIKYWKYNRKSQLWCQNVLI